MTSEDCEWQAFDQLGKYGIFSDFYYNFSSSRPVTDCWYFLFVFVLAFLFAFYFFIHLSQSCRANLMRQRFLTTMFPGGRASHLIDLKRQQSSPLLKMRQLLGLLKSLILHYISQTLIKILALCLHLLLLSYRHILVTHQKTVTISISVPPN